MRFKLNPNDPLPLYEQLAEQLRQQIAGNHLKPNEKLPSARDLSAQLKINYLTVNKVYRILESEGLVESRRGMGTFISQTDQPTRERARIKLIEKQIHELIRSSRKLGFNDAKTISLIKQKMKDSSNE